MKRKSKPEDPPEPKTMDCPDCLRVDSVCLDYYGDGTYFCQDCGSEWSTPEWDRLTKKRKR